MRRWWVTLALLLSLGINLGLLAAVAAGRWAGRPEAAEAPPPLAPPGGGRELPVATSVEVPAEPATEGEEAASRTRGEADAAGPAATGEEAGEGRRRRGGPHARGIRHGHGGGHGNGPSGEPPLGRLADHLGLAGEPRERFVALQRDFLHSHLEARRERARLGIELRRELVAPEPDAARVEELLARIGESYLASERATAAVILRSRELLDDHQQEVYFRFLERLRRDGPHAGPAAGPGREQRRR